MMEENPTLQWFAGFTARLRPGVNCITREQGLMELLLKITQLMRAGDFRSAAFLRIEFDKLSARIDMDHSLV